MLLFSVFHLALMLNGRPSMNLSNGLIMVTIWQNTCTRRMSLRTLGMIEGDLVRNDPSEK